MSRTFSLARLMLLITLTGLACGCLVNFPYDHRIEVFALYPTLIPALILFYFSKYRSLSLFVTLLGYLYGFIVCSAIMDSRLWIEQLWLEDDRARFVENILGVALPGALAVVSVCGYLVGERCFLALKNQQPQLQSHPAQPLK